MNDSATLKRLIGAGSYAISLLNGLAYRQKKRPNIRPIFCNESSNKCSDNYAITQ